MPLDRRRRRRRRRSVTPAALVVLGAAVVLAVLVGGALDVGRASAPYRREVDRSYAAQGRILVERSNETGAELRALMARITTLGRGALRQDLASLSSASSAAASSAAALSPPAPTVDGFGAVLAARAKGVADLQAGVGGLLGLGSGGRTLLPSDRAATRIVEAGTLMVRADHMYAAVRRQFQTGPGGARLPGSRWVIDPRAWTSAPVQGLVAALVQTASLAPLQRVGLRPGTVRIAPAAVPQVKPGGPSVVLPTRTLRVGTVVAETGNVGARDVTVRATLTPQGAGTPDATRTTVSLGAGASAAVTLPELRVTPGDTYTLTLSVVPPAGQTDRSRTTTTFAVRVARPTPPTTTTTTTITTTTRPTSTTRPAAP